MGKKPSTHSPKHTVAFLLLAGILCLGAALSAAAECVSLRSAHGRYLVAEPDHSVSANRTAVGAWEKWRLLGQPDGTVALQSAHGRYLVAEPDHSVSANRTAVGAWEKWRLIEHPDGTASLQSAHGRHLVAEVDDSVSANRPAIGAWERWARLPCAQISEGPTSLGGSSHPEDPPHRYAAFIDLHALPRTGNYVDVAADVGLHFSGESFHEGAVVSLEVQLRGGSGAIDPEAASIRLVSAACTHGGEEPVSLARADATESADGTTVTIPVSLVPTDSPCPDDDDVDVNLEVRFRRGGGGSSSGGYPVSIANVVTTNRGGSTPLSQGGHS